MVDSRCSACKESCQLAGYGPLVAPGGRGIAGVGGGALLHFYGPPRLVLHNVLAADGKDLREGGAVGHSASGTVAAKPQPLRQALMPARRYSSWCEDDTSACGQVAGMQGSPLLLDWIGQPLPQVTRPCVERTTGTSCASLWQHISHHNGRTPHIGTASPIIISLAEQPALAPQNI